MPAVFTSESLPELLASTKNASSKTVLLLVSPGKLHPDILTFLGRADTLPLLTQNFWLTGHNQGHPELARIGNIEAPMLVAVR